MTVLTEIGTNFGRNSVPWLVAWLTYQPNDMALAASQPYTAWTVIFFNMYTAGLSSLGVPGVPWHTQILADQLTLFQPGGTDYAHLITTGTPGNRLAYM